MKKSHKKRSRESSSSAGVTPLKRKEGKVREDDAPHQGRTEMAGGLHEASTTASHQHNTSITHSSKHSISSSTRFLPPSPTEISKGSSSPSDAVNDLVVSCSSLTCRSALLVVGFYQGLMIGLVLKGGKFYMKFSTKHHVGSVNAVAVTDRCIASSGTDERVFLFTNKLLSSASLSPEARWKLRAAGHATGVRLADLGSVSPPAEIVCVAFASHSQFLFCGSMEGQLLVYRTRDWSVSAAMNVHDRRLQALAVHPTSQGALVVTAGADHMLAVIDVVREKLLTKRKYLSGSTPLANGASAEKQTGKRQKKKGKPESEEQERLFSPLLRREEPAGVLFSSTGEWLVVYSPQACEVFYGATMQLAVQYHNMLHPQPADEIHTALWMDILLPLSPSSSSSVGAAAEVPSVTESILLIGDESGRVRYLSITHTISAERDTKRENRKHEHKEKKSSRPTSTESTNFFSSTKGDGEKGSSRGVEESSSLSYVVLHDSAVFAEVPIAYPPPLQKEAFALLAKPIQADSEARTKHPLRHISRIKGLRREGSTLFSLDARGIVICWKICLNPKRGSKSKEEPPFTLLFEASANCQGRATSMGSLWL